MSSPSRPAARVPRTRRTIAWISGLASLLGLCVLVPLVAAQPLGSEFRVNTYTTNNQRRQRVASDSTGNFVVVWQSSTQDGSYEGVFGQRYDGSGTAQGPEFRVNTYTSNSQREPAVAADGAGNFVVVWHSPQDGSNFGVFGQRYSSSGIPQGPEFRVNTYTTSLQNEAAVAADSTGNFVVVWQSAGQEGSGYNFGIFGQRYSSSGAPQGPEFRVNAFTTSSQETPAVAADSAGNFVVVWQSTGQDGSAYGLGVFGQRYSSSGAPQGAEFRVNTFTTANQYAPSVTADSAGNFVVVWTSYQDGGATGIFGQRYGSSGAPQGPEFRVNTYTSCAQLFPAVAADSTGDFVVAWYSDQEGSGCSFPGNFGVFGQRYSSGGVPQGPEFRVNTYTTSAQTYPAVAADSTGNFVVVWQSDTQDASNYGVFGQRYASIIPPCGNGTPDSGEDCDEGTSNGSPSSCCSASCALVSAGTPCRASAGVCDLAETCTGSSGSCPTDAKSTAECRAAAGDCDVAESCNGVSNGCPANTFQPSTFQCRASAGVCDPAENCPGNGPNCPADAKSTAQCRAAAGACDAAESCDGVSNDCPPDAKSTAVCRAAAGACDVAETCDGSSNDCPPDALAPALVVCRAAVDECDVAESCDGLNAACAPNGFQPNTTPCNDGNACTSGDQCSGGVCTGAPSDGTPCNDGNACTTGDQCGAGACAGTPRPNGTSCNDGNACTTGDQCGGGACAGTPRPNGTSCNDGNACTTGDQCGAGACAGTPRPNGTPCNDGNACTSGDQCAGGVCGGAPSPSGTTCNDGNACTSGDQCAGGVCEGVPRPDGALCNDGNACTSGDRCAGGACDGTSRPDGAPCNDGNACTGGDQCGGGACAGAPVPDGTSCTDANACTSGDQCGGGACAGAPVPDGTSCTDANACTSGDQCGGGACAGAPVPDGTSCTDANACTSGDQCGGGACVGAPIADGTPCNDADACTGNDSCVGGACTGEPSCIDHYLCYKIKATTDFTPPSVNLVDQFETTAAEVKKPKALCPPANKNGEGVLDPVTHEESYQIKPVVKHTPRTNVEVIDQFGTLRVNTLKADRLLVPTNKGLGSPPPAVSGTVDHYTCYKAKITPGTPKFAKGMQATVATQFETRLYDVKKPRRLCTPVDKNGEGVTSTIAHLMCYQVKAAKGQAKHAKVVGQIHTLNQFGPGRLDTVKEDVLCVPAQKNL